MKNEKDIKREINSIDALGWTTEEHDFMSRRDPEVLTIKEYAAVGFFLLSLINNSNFFTYKSLNFIM